MHVRILEAPKVVQQVEYSLEGQEINFFLSVK